MLPLQVEYGTSSPTKVSAPPVELGKQPSIGLFNTVMQ